MYVNKYSVQKKFPIGKRFFAPIQTVPGAHPGTYTMDTGLFPGVKQPGCGVDHPPSYSAQVIGRSFVYLSGSGVGQQDERSSTSVRRRSGFVHLLLSVAARWCNEVNCLISNEQRVRSWLSPTYSYWILDSSDWFTPWNAAIEGESSSRSPPPPIIYYVMKYEVTFDTGCSTINFMPVKGRNLHRCYILQLHEESIASWCCTLISRQLLLLGSIAGGKTRRRLPRKNTKSVGRGSPAILRCGSRYLSGSPCTTVFICGVIFASFLKLHYRKSLCTFEHDWRFWRKVGWNF
jgi:hypothetical protein